MDTQIAERLQKIRKEHGYSQEQLADELGVSRQAVSKWERGEASPDTDNLIALARLYSISVDNLLFDSSSEPAVIESMPTEEEEVKSGRRYHDNITGVIAGVTVMLSTIAYFIMGGVWDLWHPGWIVFLSIPVIPKFASAISERDAKIFCFPVLVTGIYLLLGCVWGLWHPWWVVFLTIPIYYIIADFIKKKK